MSTPEINSKRKSSNTSSKPLLITKKDEENRVENSKTFSLPPDKNLLEIDSKDDFNNIIKEAGDRVVMFEFFAPWCGPCKILSSKLMDLAHEYQGKLLIVKIDVDEFEDLAVEHNVTSMPTFLIMQNKRLLQQFSSSSAERLQETIEKYAGKPETEADVKVGE